MYGRLQNFSIIKVCWESGLHSWYKQKSNAPIDNIVKRFSSIQGYKYLQIYNYHNGKTGNKVFYHTKNNAYGFN